MVAGAENAQKCLKKCFLAFGGFATVHGPAPQEPAAYPQIRKIGLISSYWVLSAQARAESVWGEFYTLFCGRWAHIFRLPEFRVPLPSWRCGTVSVGSQVTILGRKIDFLALVGNHSRMVVVTGNRLETPQNVCFRGDMQFFA